MNYGHLHKICLSLVIFVQNIVFEQKTKSFSNLNTKQVGAELCQAQVKLEVVLKVGFEIVVEV